MRFAIDIAMLTFYALAMAYAWTGNLWHEIIGVLLGALVLIHSGLNFTWFKSYSMRPSPPRIFKIRNLLNVFLVIAFLVTLVTGVLDSQALFSGMPWEGGIFLRQLHVASAYWFLIFVAVHVGLHWNYLAQKVMPWKPGGWKSLGSWGLALLLSAWGIHALIVHEIHYKLILYYAFAFPDENASGWKALWDHALMQVPFAFIAFCLDRKPWKYGAKFSALGKTV